MNILLDESDPPALDSGTKSDADTVSHVASRSHSNSSDSEPLGEYQSVSDTFAPRPRSEPRRYRRLLPAPRSRPTITLDDPQHPEEDDIEQRSSFSPPLSASTSAGAPEELSRATPPTLEAASPSGEVQSSFRSHGRMPYSDWRAMLSVETR